MLDRIEQDEWLAELELFGRESDEGLTVEEWAERLHHSDKRVRRALKKAQRIGRLQRGWGLRVGLDGRSIRVPVYIVLRSSEATT